MYVITGEQDGKVRYIWKCASNSGAADGSYTRKGQKSRILSMCSREIAHQIPDMMGSQRNQRQKIREKNMLSFEASPSVERETIPSRPLIFQHPKIVRTQSKRLQQPIPELSAEPN